MKIVPADVIIVGRRLGQLEQPIDVAENIAALGLDDVTNDASQILKAQMRDAQTREPVELLARQAIALDGALTCECAANFGVGVSNSCPAGSLGSA